MIRRILLASLCLLTASAGIGCASGTTVTIPSWQEEVERYITDQGGGDPTVLGDVTLPDDRRGFAFIGRADPSQSSDVYGVLLAHQPIAGKPWFVYLAGRVEQHEVRNIQLAALNVQDGKFTWRLSPPDPASLARYRAYGEKTWRARFPDRVTAPLEYLGFPRPTDVFEVSITDDHIVAAERASGATWNLWLSGKGNPITAAADRVARLDENFDSTGDSELKNSRMHSTMHATEHVASRQ